MIHTMLAYCKSQLNAQQNTKSNAYTKEIRLSFTKMTTNNILTRILVFLAVFVVEFPKKNYFTKYNFIL